MNGQLTVIPAAIRRCPDRAQPMIMSFAGRWRGCSAWGRLGPARQDDGTESPASRLSRLAEAIHFGKKAGAGHRVEGSTDRGKGARRVGRCGGTASGAMDAGKPEVGFAVEWMRKDLGIALEKRARQRRQAPGDGAVDQFCRRGFGPLACARWPSSSMARLAAGLTKQTMNGKKASPRLRDQRRGLHPFVVQPGCTLGHQ